MFKLDKSKLIFFLGLIVPVIFVFKSFFLNLPLVWGDAPYLYSEGLLEWLTFPSSWSHLGNTLGGVNPFIWIHPLMLLYGLLHKLFGIGNDLIIRVVFYFPAIILAFIGPYLLTKYLKLSKTVSFFTSLFYVFNTYFLLLIDGGQVGVSLAYGFFPLTLLQFIKLLKNPKKQLFITSLLSTFALIVFDLRLAAILFLTILLWQILSFVRTKNKKDIYALKHVLFLGLLLVPLNVYWLFPLLRNGIGNLSTEISGQKLLTIVNSLTIFQPHFPANEFGKIFSPPWYFAGIPILVFSNIFVKKDKKIIPYLALFIVFAFLAKGESFPFGQLYGYFVNSIPFGSAFRDSSKFFMPLILFSGILIGNVVQNIKWKPGKILIYVYLLILIWPALFGKLNFVLSNRVHFDDYSTIYDVIKSDKNDFRTLWFPERHPLAFSTSKTTAVDAKTLSDLRIFSSINTGSSDKFNFMNNDGFIDRFRLFGFRYLVFPGNVRRLKLDETEKQEWQLLLNITENSSELEKLEFPNVPLYKLENTLPRIFGVENAFLVVGSDRIYETSPIYNQGYIFAEDEKLDLHDLFDYPDGSVEIVFKNKDRLDLKMSFLKDYFIDTGRFIESQWANYSSSQYLDWKYQLLIRDLVIDEFDFGKGISFSSNKGERMTFNIKSEGGEHVLAIRGFGNFSYKINDQSGTLEHGGNDFGWNTFKLYLKEGINTVSFENEKNLSVVNTFVLIPSEKWNKTEDLTVELLDKFDVVGKSGAESVAGLNKIPFEKTSPTKYKITDSSFSGWVVLTDLYHPMWKMGETKSLPFYSAVNGFFYDGTSQDVVFEGQKYLDLGVTISLTSLSLLVAYIILQKKW